MKNLILSGLGIAVVAFVALAVGVAVINPGGGNASSSSTSVAGSYHSTGASQNPAGYGIGPTARYAPVPVRRPYSAVDTFNTLRDIHAYTRANSLPNPNSLSGGMG